MNFIGSQTEKNLLAAFAGESQARNKYTFFASVARKEGYEQIGLNKRRILTLESVQSLLLVPFCECES
jgi:rubrerythrin